MRPTTFVPNPRNFPKQLPHRAPYLLSEHEVVRLLAGTRTINPSRKNPLRHATMRVALLLLYCCGLRRGELLKLRLADIDTEQQVLRIQQTKFYKSRLVPCSSSVGEELRKYLQQRHCQGMPMDPSMPLVWNGRSGRTSGALSPTAISANWFRICRCAGVLDHRGRAPRIHDLRHSFAVTALRRGYDAGQHPQATLPRLARYLGHASPAFTHYYLKFTEPLYQAASARFHRHCVGSLILSTIAHWLGHSSINTTHKYVTIDLEAKRAAIAKAEPIAVKSAKSRRWKTDEDLLQWLQSL